MKNEKNKKQDELNVLHIVGRLTNGVFNFLSPASKALADAGHRQTVVMLDDPKYRHFQYKLPPEVHVEIVSTEYGEKHPWVALGQLTQQLIAENNFTAFHLHGLMAWAAGTRMGMLLPPKANVFYSPHRHSRSSSLLGPLQGMVGGLMSALGTKHHQIIGNSQAGKRGGSKSLLGQRVTSFETTVQDDFFNIEPKKSRRPLLISGNAYNNHRSAEMFCRLAVVMGAAELGLSFNWLGRTDSASAARLQAANVSVVSSTEPHELANKLASAWIFIASSDADEFPLMLGRAMAAGLPCVVRDTAPHVALIKHGHNGLVYNTEAQAMTMVGQLIDNPVLREQLGAAAKADAQARFSTRRVDGPLLAAYTRSSRRRKTKERHRLARVQKTEAKPDANLDSAGLLEK